MSAERILVIRRGGLREIVLAPRGPDVAIPRRDDLADLSVDEVAATLRLR